MNILVTYAGTAGEMSDLDDEDDIPVGALFVSSNPGCSFPEEPTLRRVVIWSDT